MDEPVFDLRLKVKCRRLSPLFYYSVLYLAVFFCIPEALTGILLFVIILSGELEMPFPIGYVILGGMITVMTIGAVIGIRLWRSEASGHYVFYDDRFEVMGGKSKFTFTLKYSEIVKIRRKKELYYFYLRHANAFYVGGTDKENTAAFEEFITSKTGVLIENIKRKEVLKNENNS